MDSSNSFLKELITVWTKKIKPFTQADLMNDTVAYPLSIKDIKKRIVKFEKKYGNL